MIAVVAASLALVLGVLAPDAVAAQENGAVEVSAAYMVTPPTRGRSLPVLPANTLTFVSAAYEIAGERVTVYVTGATPAAPPAPALTWTDTPCAAAAVERGTHSDTAPAFPVYRISGAAYAVYLSGPLTDDLACRVASAFLGPFQFFLTELDREIGQGQPPEFPAVLDIAQ